MATTAFLGMVGTGDWQTDERPKSWGEVILYLNPNGDMPLTAILSKAKKSAVTDPQFYWWTQTLPTMGGACALYTDAALSSALAADTSTEGTTLYAKVAEAVADFFRAGHVVILRYTSDPSVDVVGKVTAVVKNGASSYMAVRLLEDDDNSTSYGLSDCDYIGIIGNANPEGGDMPDAVSWHPEKLYNYTQIFRTPLEITGTAMQTQLRTPDSYKRQKTNALMQHGLEMENAFLWGIPTENTGVNGKPERTTMGAITACRTYAPSNCSDYRLATGYAALTWKQGGEDWFNNMLEQIFRYGGSERMAFCGSGALLGLQQLIKAGAQFNITEKTGAYGINVREWITPFGTVYLKLHPLFSHDSTNRYSMFLFEPANITYRPLRNRDTKYFKDDGKASNGRRVDGITEEYMTEAGLEFHYPSTWAFLSGLGQNNTL